MDNDIIDISMDFDNLDNGSKSIFGKSKSNFGGGIELLMNDNKPFLTDQLVILI